MRGEGRQGRHKDNNPKFMTWFIFIACLFDNVLISIGEYWYSSLLGAQWSTTNHINFTCTGTSRWSAILSVFALKSSLFCMFKFKVSWIRKTIEEKLISWQNKQCSWLFFFLDNNFVCDKYRSGCFPCEPRYQLHDGHQVKKEVKKKFST